MDSTTALHWAKKEHTVVACISFWYGSKHNDMEFKAAQQVAGSIPIMRAKLDFVAEAFQSDLLKSGGEVPEGHYADESMKRTVVPFRNGIMLSIAAGWAESLGADAVVLGNHAGDHTIYPDCRLEFITAMKAAIVLGTYKQIRLLSPFVLKTKADIVKIGTELAVPFEKTYSCYKGEETHCGLCGTCNERKEAFQLAGILDPTEYKA